MEKFKFLEHTADVFIEAYGGTLEKVFENCALGLSKLMIENIEDAEGSVKRVIEVEGEDLKALLFEFLTQFLILHDSENLIFPDIKVNEIKKNGKYFLSAEAKGEEFDVNKHQGNVHVKAITYHEMEIETEEEISRVKVLVDI